MLVADIVKRVRDSAGDTAILQFTNQTLTDWINDGIRECVTENSLLQVRMSQNTVINQSDYALPSDIFKFHSVLVNQFKLEMITLQQWEERNAGETAMVMDAGEPVVCYVYAGVLTLWPKPSAVVPLTINYTKLPTAIAYSEPGGTPTWAPTTPSIPEHYHNRIVTYCLAQVAMQDDNYEKYQALMLEFQTGVKQMNDARHEDDLYPFISPSSRDMGEYWNAQTYIL